MGPGGERLLILSRKGFDSGFGGRPSPVLPDGRMVSLPIPEDPSPVSFGECLIDPGTTVASLMADLGVPDVRLTRGGKTSRLPLSPGLGAHLDPDLRREGRAGRVPQWRPMFGQVGAAQKHLANCGVGPGDVFLFFGWFAHVRYDGTGSLKYARRDRGFQAIWGWMEIGEALPARQFAAQHPWAWQQHPHLHPVVPPHYTHNTIYAAASASSLVPSAPGAAVLRYSPKSLLTKPGNPPSMWSLPSCFHPDNTKTPLTYHGKPGRWSDIEAGDVTLRSVARGQEFVVPVNQGIADWLTDLIATASCW